MNKSIAKQSMAFDHYDYATLEAGAVEQVYVVGTLANAALAGTWPAEGGLPSEAQYTRFYATQDVLIRLIPVWLIGRQALPAGHPFQIPAGFPVQILIPAGVYYDVDVKWIRLMYVRAGAVDAGLRVEVRG